MQVDTDLANLERRSMRRPIQRTLHRRCKLGLKADFAALSRTIRDCCAASASSQERRFEGPQEPVMETEASFARVDADDMLVAPGTHWERIEATDENWVATTMKSKEGDDDFAAWPPPPDAGDPPQTRFGINTPRYFSMEVDGARAYGDYTEITSDLLRLGVTVGRHPTKLQLLIPDLIGSEMPVNITDIQALVDGAVVWDHLEQLVRHLASMTLNNPFELYITLLAQGSEDLDGPVTAPEGITNPLGLTWSTDHSAASVTEDEFTATPSAPETYAFDANPTATGWDQYTFDPVSGYKRWYYTRICRAIGSRLSALRDTLYLEKIYLEDYIYAVEICNEIEIKHTVLDSSLCAQGDAQNWGEFYFWCAVAFREGCDWAPIMLPGLASYGARSTDDIFAWEGKYSFLTDLVKCINNLCVDTGRADFDDLVSGIDYHYYHRSTTDAQILLYLPIEIAQIRDSLQTYNPDAMVNVLESSVSCHCGEGEPTTDPDAPEELYDSLCEGAREGYPDPYDEYSVAGSTAPDARPDAYVPSLSGLRLDSVAAGSAGDTQVGALDFQAQSVWMRLAAAHCAGVPVAGWHCLMADTQFLATGLRRDCHNNRLTVDVAQQRPSWWAFQQYVQQLGSAARVSLLAPVISFDHDTLSEMPLDVSLSTWVVEYETEVWYVYLVFLDPFGAVDCAAVRFQSAASPDEELLGGYSNSTAPTQADTLPASSGFPTYDWHSSMWEYVIPRSTRFTVMIGRGQYPILIKTQQRLAVNKVYGPGRVPPAGTLLAPFPIKGWK